MSEALVEQPRAFRPERWLAGAVAERKGAPPPEITRDHHPRSPEITAEGAAARELRRAPPNTHTAALDSGAVQ